LSLKFESPADAGLSNRSIGAEAPAAAFGKTASADFASAGYKIDFEIAFENCVLKKARDRFRGKTGNAAGL
jgi:hypothetical protein